MIKQHVMKNKTYLVLVALCAIIYFFRGIALLCILPPFEGWDESSHIAYVQYVVEHHSAPVQGVSGVPVFLAALFSAYPHPECDLEQRAFVGVNDDVPCATNVAGILMRPMMKAWGGLNYSSFWACPTAPQHNRAAAQQHSIHLYQAQHPPYYYFAVAPVWQYFWSVDPLLSIAVLRIINLILGVLTIVIIGIMLGALVPDLVCRAFIFLVIVFHPLYLLNVTRVSNDALAILLGTAAIAILATVTERRVFLYMTLASAMLGFGVLIKEVVLTLTPLLPLTFILYVRKYRLSFGSAARTGIAVGVIFAAITALPFYNNYHHHGSIVSIQGNYLMKKSNVSVGKLLYAIVNIRWLPHAKAVLVPGTPWLGGWSLLRAPRILRDVHGTIMTAGMFLGVLGISIVIVRVAGCKQSLACTYSMYTSWPPLIIFAAVVTLVSAGICYHVLIYKVTKNIEVSAAWHFAIAIPFLYLLILQCVRYVGWRVLGVFATWIACCFWITEFVGLFSMATFYTASTTPSVIFHRLALLHPALLHPAVLLMALLGVCSCIIVMATLLVRITGFSYKTPGRYYYDTLTCIYRFIVPEKSTVLEVDYRTGDIIAQLNPVSGVVVDISPAAVRNARSNHDRHATIEYVAGATATFHMDTTFEYVIMPDVIGYLDDVQGAFENVRRMMTPRSRLVINSANYMWKPVLRMATWLGWQQPQPEVNWFSNAAVVNLLARAGFEIVHDEGFILLPLHLPIISDLVNGFLAKLPGLRHLTLAQFVIARPAYRPARENVETYSVSVIVPARNEARNIEAAVLRTPEMGAWTELIFVEGHSTDSTWEELQRVQEKYPQRRIKIMRQDGQGKNDAVDKGFAHAQGDVLMMLDADLTMPPEELPNFYCALASNVAEYINGCRLVYPMAKQPMRFLNMLGNRFFSMAFSYILGQTYKDILCGTKVLLRKDWERVQADHGCFGDFDACGDFGIIFGAAKLNLKTMEIPVRYCEPTSDSTKISRFSRGWLLLCMTWIGFIKLKWNVR